MVEHPLELYIGLDFGPCYFHAKDHTGAVFVLTGGWNVESHIRRWPTQELLIDLSPVISDAAQGIITLEISRADIALLDPDEYAIWDLIAITPSFKRIGPIVGGAVAILLPATQLV